MIMPNYVCDRRRYVRVSMHRPVKVRCPRSGRTLVGETVDTSAGGCLLRLDHGALLNWGQAVRVGIAQDSRGMLMLADEMREGHVVRCHGLDGTIHIAIAYDQANPLAEAG